jgi:hypothetical protein
MESTIRLFRNTLFDAYWEWVETNKHAISEGMYESPFDLSYSGDF